MELRCLQVDACTIPTNQLYYEVNRLKTLVTHLESMMSQRTGDIQYGYVYKGNVLLYNFFADAVNAAVQDYNDPDAGYKVTTYYV